MNAITSSPVTFRLKWLTHYLGPNPYAMAPVVLAELSATGMICRTELRKAIDTLWLSSGMAPLEADEVPSKAHDHDNDDPLLQVGQAITQWALAALNEVRGFIQHAGASRQGKCIQLWLGFHHADLSRAAVQLALRALGRLINQQPERESLAASLEQLFHSCRLNHPDFQARILMLAAEQEGIPWLPFLRGNKFWQFGWGHRSRVFFETSSHADSMLGWQWQRNKVTSVELMRSIGMPTPKHVLVHHEHELQAAATRMGLPCVVKPLDGGGGNGVTADIQDIDSLRLAFRHARLFSAGPLLVEQHIPGFDYRLMVVDGQMVAAIRREASSLIGDGKSTVAELLARLNAKRPNNLVKSRYLKPIATDSVLTQHLQRQGVALDSVLPDQYRVTLRSNANRSTGGVCSDVTALVHPQIRAMAEQIARITSLRAAGIDYLTTDITKSPWEAGGSFIEINATPGMSVMVAAGLPEAAIGRVLLGQGLGTIPVALTVLPPDGLEQQRNLWRQLATKPHQGWVCGQEVRIGSATLLVQTDNDPWASVYAALRNPDLQELQVACTVDELQSNGLPVARLQKITLQGTSLDAAWSKVLHAACP